MAEEKDTIGRDEPLNEEAPTPQTAGDAADAAPAADAPARAGKFDRLTQDEGGVRKLTGMYKNWFLDYASYVILERAVPHVEDGLKPVQRRILHAMKVVDDGRYNKVANIVGQTMQYHPHGDASIKDALVQLGQKDLLIDCQGNWGNILTGDEAAAGRYIEARLSKFASEVVFNKKTTEWMLSYDGRKEEPVTLPIKFPLLLAQGSDGIAVGLASKILPHNFVELINACIAHLEGREFQLYPDFPTGGMADVSRYNDGLRGGAVKVRAKISKIDKRTLGHHRNTLYHDHRVDQGFDHQGQRQGQDQDQEGRRQYGRQGRNHHPGFARRVERQNHRRPLRLHRLRGFDLSRTPASSGRRNPISWA